MAYDRARLIKQLRIDEGCKFRAYQCPAGIWTCGVGHNLEAHPDKDYPPRATTSCTPEKADEWLISDINEAERAMLNRWPWMRDIAPDAYEAVLNLCFNMGAATFSGFPNTLKALRDHDYESAAHHLEQSKWYLQVGKRAQRVVAMMRGAK
jgi:lysozyme